MKSVCTSVIGIKTTIIVLALDDCKTPIDIANTTTFWRTIARTLAINTVIPRLNVVKAEVTAEISSGSGRSAPIYVRVSRRSLAVSIRRI
jgi:hypothetical protein